MNSSAVRLTVSTIILTLSFLCNPGAYGQSVKQVEGIVSDQGGGVIPGATVILISDDRIWTSKTNSDGEFDFANFIGPASYFEVYSVGFMPVRIAVADTTPQPVKIILQVGSFSQCIPTTVPSANYEERSGNVQLTGSVIDDSGSPLPHANLMLTRLGLDNHLITGEPSIAPASTDGKGEFQFENLEPGRYSLTATREGFNSPWSVNFWIARKSLTRTTQIRLVPKGGAGIGCQYDSLALIAPDKSASSQPTPAAVAPIPLPFKCSLKSVCQY
jgi:hypothetical protein